MGTPTIPFSELLMAFDFASTGQPGDTSAFLCRETGKFYFHSEYGDNLEPLPDDVDDVVTVPHKKELGLGKPLVLKFAEEVMPDALGKVHEIFSSRGAYARFKDLLEYRDLLKQWQEFEDHAHERALRAWCEDNQIEIDG